MRRSTDGGATWTSIANGLPAFLAPAKIAVDPNHPETIYLANSCASRLAAAGGLFRSDDRGDTWSGPTSGKCITDAAIDPRTDAVYPLARDTFFVAFQPAPLPTHQIVGHYGIGYDSRDGYATEQLVVLENFSDQWQKLAGLQPNVHELALDAATGRLFAAASNGIFMNPTGGPYWIPLLAAPARNVAIGGGVLYVNTSRGMLRAPLATLAPFTALGPLPGAPAAARGLAADPNTGVLYAASDGVWRSGDAGASWQTSDAVPFDDVDELFLANGALYAIQAGTLLKAMDGKTWQQILTGVHAFAFDANVLYAGTARGLLVSLDGGATWKTLDAAETTAIAVAPSRSSTLYRSANGLQRSDDGGATWHAVNAPAAVNHIAVDPLSESSLWIAGEGKLWHSADGGRTWEEQTGNLPAAVEQLLVDRDGRHLHVLAGGVWDAAVRAERRRSARK